MLLVKMLHRRRLRPKYQPNRLVAPTLARTGRREQTIAAMIKIEKESNSTPLQEPIAGTGEATMLVEAYDAS